MTWSIIARDKATGPFGIAVATKFFAVGARVPFIAAGVGAVATQALVNPFYGTNGIALLREGIAGARESSRRCRRRCRARSSSAPYHRRQRPRRRPYRDGLHRLERHISMATDFPSPATCWRGRACSTIPRQPISPMRPAVSPPADRRDAGWRSRRRRQARQAVGALVDLWRGGLVRSRSARRRSRRTAGRAGAARTHKPGALDVVPALSAEPPRSRGHHRPRLDRAGNCRTLAAAGDNDRDPACRNRRPEGHVPRRPRARNARRRHRQFRSRARRNARHRRRIRLRQERHLARHHGLAAESIPRKSPAPFASTASIC